MANSNQSRSGRVSPVPPDLVLLGLVFLFTMVQPLPAVSEMAVGICEDYQEHKTDRQDLKSDFQAMETLGVDFIRVALAWDGTHKGPDEFDWSFWDQFFEVASNHDVDVVPYLAYTPSWASSQPDADDYWRQPPENPSTYGAFVEAVVQRYGNQVRAWELWNEPDNQHFWQGSPAEFSSLLRTGHEAIRNHDDSVPIVFGGLTSTGDDFLRTLFRDHDGDQYVDVVNYHNYFETWNPDPLESLPEYLNRTQDVINDHGTDQEIWKMEVGYSDHKDGPEVSGVYRALWDHEHTPGYQAEHLTRNLVLSAAQGSVGRFAWYRLRDLPDDEPVIGDDNNRHLGVYERDGTLKPAGRRLQLWQNQFKQARPADLSPEPDNLDEPLRVETIRLGSSEDSNLAVFAWIPNRTESSTGEEELSPDLRQVNTSLTLPRKYTIQQSVLSRLGEKFELIGSGRGTTTDELTVELNTAGETAWWVLEP